MKIKNKNLKALGSFITDYINNTLAKSEVPNMYIVGGVSFRKQA